MCSPRRSRSVLIGIEGTSPHYLMVVDRKPGQLDELEVQVEVSEQLFSDEVTKLEALTSASRRRWRTCWGCGWGCGWWSRSRWSAAWGRPSG